MDILGLIGGLTLFLYGMHVMGDALEKRAGNKLKAILASMTSNLFKGFFLGLVVTAVIQSSSATTVMVVGFVNSGIMTLNQAVGVIMGANLGTSITSWILSLTGVSGSAWYIQIFKPASFVPVLALIGIIFFMFVKKAKYKDTGLILVGFATLMFGMEMMSDAVSGLGDMPAFKNIFLLFGSNPILGVLAGAVITAIIQSSSASVGILQALTLAKGSTITVGATLPIIMGQNIGTCVTAMISCVGASKNARRAAFIHLTFNTLGTLIILPVYWILDLTFGFAFTDMIASPLTIAICHSIFNILAIAILLPLNKVIVKIATALVQDKKGEDRKTELLDERLLATPPVAIERSRVVAVSMAEIAVNSLKESISLFDKYDENLYEKIREDENRVDMYEDKLGTYLVKLTSQSLSEQDSIEANKLLHVIGDFERISDHALNIAASAEEINDKKIEFSGEAKKELATLMSAINEILDITLQSFSGNDLDRAVMVEPLEQVVDSLKETLKKRHIKRLTKQ
ncbi:MAG: Na/Pi cotransporter family protein, partial [Ruminococcaceae bacterium]|nr:Na/Pi cotransporter family protein [Oscillospiraceae bacterium]